MTAQLNERDRPQLLLTEWAAELTTRSGLRLNVRPAAPEDEALLGDFFKHVTQDDLRFRFLSAVREVGHNVLVDLVKVDHTQTENFLAFDAETKLLVATAMLAAEPSMRLAEVAIAVRTEYKHRGIGWTLLDYVAGYATARGIKKIESVESRDNREAISLEREMGFTAKPYPGDATLIVLQKELA